MTTTAPQVLAERIRPLLDGALVAFDVDGVLAPIVSHPDLAAPLPGVVEALARLARTTAVAIVSGRSLADLECRFGFPEPLHVVGSHGLEVRGDGPVRLDPVERHRLARLRSIADTTATASGAWVEHKPASVVVHTRLARPTSGRRTLAQAAQRAAAVPGASVRCGHCVVELFARSASKGDALLGLARRLGRSPIVHVGDDLTDEEAFSRLGPHDVTVRVGPGATVARFRLRDPAAVAALVTHLTRPAGSEPS